MRISTNGAIGMVIAVHLMICVAEVDDARETVPEPPNVYLASNRAVPRSVVARCVIVNVVALQRHHV